MTLAASLPPYRENLNDKLAFLAGDGDGAMRPLGDLAELLQRVPDTTAPAAAQARPSRSYS